MLDTPSAVRTLHPGDVACVEQGGRMETLLGSCVAVVLTDPRRTIGAMCHIVHPRDPAPGTAGNGTAHAGRAIDAMFAMLRARAIEPRLCDAYVYGGANMFPAVISQARHVGEHNVAVVIDRLNAEGVRIVCQDIGGTAYRKLAWSVGPLSPAVVAVEV